MSTLLELHIYYKVCGTLVAMKQWNEVLHCFSNREEVPQAYFDHPWIGYPIYRYEHIPFENWTKISTIPTSSYVSTRKPSIHPFLFIVGLEGHLELIISLNMHDMFNYFHWYIFPPQDTSHTRIFNHKIYPITHIPNTCRLQSVIGRFHDNALTMQSFTKFNKTCFLTG